MAHKEVLLRAKNSPFWSTEMDGGDSEAECGGGGVKGGRPMMSIFDNIHT